MFPTIRQYYHQPSIPDLPLGQSLLGSGWVILTDRYLMVVVIDLGNPTCRGLSLLKGSIYEETHLTCTIQQATVTHL